MIVCVPIGDPMWNNIHSLDQVPAHLLKESEHFFEVYKDLEKKKTGNEKVLITSGFRKPF